MKTSKNQKSNLAKLLATENIQVEHNKVVTAQFDVKNRILTLPIWKEMSNDLYDMLCGHEVGHALYTPDFSKKQYKRVEKIPHSYLNILEDVRIDKKIKQKYPGLKSSYYRGQSELRDRGFFGDQDRPLNTYKFIDRLNIHSKNGSIEPVSFSDEEQKFVDEAMNTETFDDVINLAEKIVGYAKQEKTPEYKPETADDDIDFGDDEDQLIDNTLPDNIDKDYKEEEKNNGGSDGEEKPDEKTTASSKSNKDESSKEENKQEEKTENKIGSDAGYDPNNLEHQIGSETDKSLNENIKSFVDNTAKRNSYANLPEPKLSCVVTADRILKKLNAYYSNDPHSSENYLSEKGRFNKWSLQQFKKFKKENTPIVQYMVKEFEMKKSADEYKRATVSKTGVINVNKLHAYNYIDDIFKKMTVLPGSKNHGLIIVLDHSGSMHQNMYNTMTQLFNLTFFCKQVNIPFDVYSFSDLNLDRYEKSNDMDSGFISRSWDYNINGEDSFNYKVGDKVMDNVTMFNWVSSSQNLKQYNQAMLNLFKIALDYKDIGRRYIGYNDYENNRRPYCSSPSWTRLGGTPLNSAIVVTSKIVKEFEKKHKIQKMNTVFLTDGASHDNYSVVGTKDGKLAECSHDYDSNLIIRCNKTKLELRRQGYRDITKAYLKWFKVITGSKLIGFYVYNRTLNIWDRDNIFGINGLEEYEKQKKLQTKTKVMISKSSGYDSLFLIKSNNLNIENEELEVNDTMSVSQIKRNFGKTMKNRITSRVLLNKFVDLVA